MTAEEWVKRFAAGLALPPPSQAEASELLELASVAAHSSERIAAPLACWLAGVSGRTPAEAIEAAKELGED
jgi:hypothetical protein